ncbi:hypothetical protein C4573_00230 [Candidatus Woesearchaeota archaeon]|nr:MAG: hypothetical protein C4573_00230 [Candidatus Woesearchaeota archaeon]
MITLSYTPIAYKESQFMDIIEKRVRKEIRKYGYFKAKEKVYVLDDGSKEFAVSVSMLKGIFKDVLTLLPVKKLNAKKIIIPWNLEREITEKFSCFLEHKKFPKRKKNHIYLLKCVLDEELEVYAKLKKLSYTPKKEPCHQIIEEMQKQHPETKFSLYRSFEQL